MHWLYWQDLIFFLWGMDRNVYNVILEILTSHFLDSMFLSSYQILLTSSFGLCVSQLACPCVHIKQLLKKKKIHFLNKWQTMLKRDWTSPCVYRSSDSYRTFVLFLFFSTACVSLKTRLTKILSCSSPVKWTD